TPDFRIEYMNRAYEALTGRRDVVGKTAMEAFPEPEEQGFIQVLAKVYASGEPEIGRDVPRRLRRQPEGTWQQLYLDFIYQPIIDADGIVTGILCAGSDVTEEHIATDRAQKLQAKLTHASRMSA